MVKQQSGGGFHPGHSPWAVALTVTLATFMEVMDTSIANVALPHIAGGLSAGQDEATWVLTSYLVSNAIVLPISAWLSDRVGRKKFYMSCVALFTISSALCGLAPTLGMLVLFRVLQGIGGGGLGPSEQAIMADTFPPAQRGMAFAVYGMAVVLAPAIGPTLGGWITDNFSWRWIFYVNVPVGALSLFFTNFMVQDPPHVEKAKKASKHAPIDFTGLVLVATGLGALQVVLDKGQRDDWFASGLITTFTIITIATLVAFVVWELKQKHPIVEMRLFKKPTFAVSSALMLTLGLTLFGSTVLIPQFLQVELGYSAQRAGEVLTPGGIAILFMMPIVGFLVSRVDPRFLIAFGFLTTAAAMIHMTNLTLGIDQSTATLWRVYQAAGLAFLFVPINTISYVGVKPEENNQVSGMLNLMRNVGGAIGISMVTTLLSRREQIHQVYLSRNTFEGNRNLEELLQGLRTHYQTQMGSAEATQHAWGNVYGTVIRQAAVLAYIDVFWVVGTMCGLAMLLLLLLKKVKAGSVEMGH